MVDISDLNPEKIRKVVEGAVLPFVIVRIDYSNLELRAEGADVERIQAQRMVRELNEGESTISTLGYYVYDKSEGRFLI